MRVLFIIFLWGILLGCGITDPIYSVEVKCKNTSSKDLNLEIYYAGKILIKKEINMNDNVTVISELTENKFPLDGNDSLKIIFSDGKKLIYKPKNYYKEFQSERSLLNYNVYEKKENKNNILYQYTIEEKDYLLAK